MPEQGDDVISAWEVIRQNPIARDVFQALAQQLGQSGWGVAKSLNLNPNEVAAALNQLTQTRLIRASDPGLDGNYTLTDLGFTLKEQIPGSRYSRSRLR
jgi:hypothetical protein